MQPPRDTQRLPAFDHPGVQNAPTEQFAARPADAAAPLPGDGAGEPRGGSLTGRRIVIGAVLAIVLLVAGAVGLELGMRGAIKDNLRQEISATLGSTPEVELGPQPVLLSYVTGTLGTIRITTDGAPAEGATGPVPAIDITAEGVRSEGETSRIDSLTGTAFVSDETMTAAAQSEGAGGVGDSLLGGLIQVKDIVSDPAAGALRVSISGLAEAVVTPRLIDGNLEMDPQQASVLGFQLPSEILGGTVSMMDSALADLPEGIELTGVRVVDGGMTVDLAGRDVVLESTR
ncbi:hypothetical protein A2U19_11585 [Dietzia maris]|uniref:LmeA family phospholipid-binding protein n=1 Tax=Dietzia papillomatosis TaxID=282305 RepID=UPI0007852C9D|nr:DUF2993 domain-containing protein [Dietzia papillomatosis]KZO58526.1 hypothetical protein A2U19_11585 [Dietzia maris]